MWYRSIIAQTKDKEVFQQQLPIRMSATLDNILRTLASYGKRALIVGGAVRDAIQGYEPKDIDIEIYNISYSDLANVLSNFGRTDLVGKSFGVIKLTDSEGNDYDFSIPRRDSKSGIGHKSFTSTFDQEITPKEAASRRDFTMNALAYDPLSNEVHDYFGGVEDLKNKTLRATGPAFAEDPLRVLRGMQFAGRMGLVLDPETAQVSKDIISNYDTERPRLIHDYVNGGRERMLDAYYLEHQQDVEEYMREHPKATVKDLLKNVPDESKKLYPENPEEKFAINVYETIAKERVGEEWMKLATKGKKPGTALQYLIDTGWISFFPRLEQIIGVPQDSEWHPEGWSTSVVPADSLITSMAEPKPINLLTRDLIQSAIANSTRSEPRDVASRAKFSIQKRIAFTDLFSTSHTGISNLCFSPSINSPTSITPSKSLMGRRVTVANATNKIIRVMFQIPLRSVLAIMQPSVDDLKVAQGIIESAAVYMMNMLGGQKLSSQIQLHNISMDEYRPTNSRDGDLGISSRIVDPKFFIINDNVVFDFNLSLVGDIDIHNNIDIPHNNEAYLVNFGDVGTHTGHVMDEAAAIADREGRSGDDRAVDVLAALTHDLAKSFPEHGGTTMLREKGGQQRWTSHGHEEAGGPMAREFLQSIGIKRDIINRVVPMVERHLAHIALKPDKGSIRQLADSIHPATIQELVNLMEADHSGRPPLPKQLPEQAQKMLELAKQEGVHNAPPVALISGRDVMPYFYNKGGPQIGEAVKDAYQAQLKGAISTPEEAKAWLDNYIKNRASLLRGEHVLPYFGGKGGPEIGGVLNTAWEAQRAGNFQDEASAQEWLRQHMQSRSTNTPLDQTNTVNNTEK